MNEPPQPPTEVREPPTELHEPPRDHDPKRRRAALGTPVVIVLIVAGVAWGIPILQGYHFGCNVLAGDTVRTTRLGFEMCRPESQAEANEKREHAAQEQQAKEHGEAEQRTAHEHQAAEQQQAERPGLEADAANLKSEAAGLHAKQQHEEALVSHDKSEAARYEQLASHTEGEEPEGGNGGKTAEAGNLTAVSGNWTAKAGEHEASASSAKSEAESKEQEATADFGKGRPLARHHACLCCGPAPGAGRSRATYRC